MPSKFDTFADALAALCKHQRVVMAPTSDGYVGVWEVSEGDIPVNGLVDCTVEAPKPQRTDGPALPHYFMTILAARALPGYVGHKMVQSAAYRLAECHPGARVVSIGPPRHVRSWAVIRKT